MTADSSENAVCPFCGGKNVSDAAFCMHCGLSLDSQDVEVVEQRPQPAPNEANDENAESRTSAPEPSSGVRPPDRSDAQAAADTIREKGNSDFLEMMGRATLGSMLDMFSIRSGRLTEHERLTFCEWAGLPADRWTSAHTSVFVDTCLSIVRHVAPPRLPQELFNIVPFLPPEPDPPLVAPLVDEIIEICTPHTDPNPLHKIN